MKFKIFVCVALVVIVLLQAAIVGILAFAGKKAQTAVNTVQKTLTDKTVIINKDTTQMNKSLQKADNSLDQINKTLQQSPYSKQVTQIP